jgi:hypothetical protein
MLKKRCNQSAWRSVTVHSRQYSPAATAGLSRMSRSVRNRPSVEKLDQAVMEMIEVIARIAIVTVRNGVSPRPLAK